MTGKAIVTQGNALALQLPDESVDLIVTSPPYFALRSYRDGGEHYEGQIGSEESPQAFLEALWAATAEMKRVLKPSGSIWVNLGDKYANAAPSGNTGKTTFKGNTKFASKTFVSQTASNRHGIPTKSLMGLPWRYAIGCIDQLGLILRAEVIWSKPNGLPESVTDRVRRSHEQWFHFTKSPRYFAAVDEIREPHAASTFERGGGRNGLRIREESNPSGTTEKGRQGWEGGVNPLGKLPGSVWTIPSEPLRVPPEVGVDHFAAFPSAWPVRIISGWSPTGICTACGEPRRPVVEKEAIRRADRSDTSQSFAASGNAEGRSGFTRDVTWMGEHKVTLTGYACGCNGCVWGPNDVAPSTRPAVVLDPFGGTGTVAMVAKQLGRVGISVDLSADYCRLAEWRCNVSDHGPKAIAKAVKKGLLRSEEAQLPTAGSRPPVRRDAEQGVAQKPHAGSGCGVDDVCLPGVDAGGGADLDRAA